MYSTLSIFLGFSLGFLSLSTGLSPNVGSPFTVYYNKYSINVKFVQYSIQ